jgi:hypothetical protein
MATVCVPSLLELPFVTVQYILLFGGSWPSYNTPPAHSNEYSSDGLPLRSFFFL